MEPLRSLALSDACSISIELGNLQIVAEWAFLHA